MMSSSEISVQLDAAARVVCQLVAAEDVGSSFSVATPLTTQPMGELNGPACGYPNLDGHGYLFVIQFQPWSRWDSYAGSGQPIESLGAPVILAVDGADGSRLYVRDAARQVTTMFLAPTGGSGSAKALQRLAALAYPVTH